MGCPTQAILDLNLTFTVQCLNSNGIATDATGNVSYSVYEDETGTAIATGTMAKLDDAGTAGFYSEQIATSTANGYERYKSYTIRVTATVATVAIAKSYTFMVVGGSDTVTSTQGALTTTANVKAYCGITGTADDTLIAALINRATDAIEEYCGRVLTEDTYREIYDGDGTTDLFTGEYPVNSVQLLSIGRDDAFTVKNTSSDAYNAYVQINATIMTLVVQGGGNDGSDSITLASVSPATLRSLLVTLTI